MTSYSNLSDTITTVSCSDLKKQVTAFKVICVVRVTCDVLGSHTRTYEFKRVKERSFFTFFTAKKGGGVGCKVGCLRH